MRLGWALDKIYELTGIDHWFLYQLKELVDKEQLLKDIKLADISFETMLDLKQRGFADHRIAYLIGAEDKEVRYLRQKLEILPSIKVMNR